MKFKASFSESLAKCFALYQQNSMTFLGAAYECVSEDRCTCVGGG